MNWKFLLFLLCLSKTYGQIAYNNYKKPNVIIIITDDQGYGDFGFTGNPHVKTPVLDLLSKTSIRFNDFYVSPVCAPTRASLMTGRQSLRTGIRDTYNGGAIMHADEVTLAEMLSQANYKTGIFGKWHLGDNYPSRPMDQGFGESLIHLSGGMAQVGDVTTYFQYDSAYFNPVLWHNGKQKKYEGYCSDIFADEAIDFIDANKDSPFFCYLSFNAPHTPLQLPEKYYEMYKDIDPSVGLGENKEVKAMSEKDKEDARKVYGMVSNIDENIGKLLNRLEELEISDNTILIFMTDNGPQQRRYTGGMRGTKTMVYRGGVRVPMLLTYPKLLNGNKDVDFTSTHMDIMPTIAELCHLDLPKDRIIDGRSLVPFLKNGSIPETDRPLFFSWARRFPELYHNVALQKGDFRLIGMTDYDSKIERFELYNFKNDPGEEKNIISENKSLALDMKAEFDKQYQEIISSEHLINQPVISVGTPRENPSILNRNDAGGERGIWAQEEVFGQWRLDVSKGKYKVKFKFINPVEAGTAFLEIGSMVFQKEFKGAKLDSIELDNIDLPNITADLIPFYMSKGKRIFPFYVEMERVDI
jgi:arylsulfatase A-like enzyme